MPGPPPTRPAVPGRAGRSGRPATARRPARRPGHGPPIRPRRASAPLRRPPGGWPGARHTWRSRERADRQPGAGREPLGPQVGGEPGRLGLAAGVVPGDRRGQRPAVAVEEHAGLGHAGHPDADHRAARERAPGRPRSRPAPPRAASPGAARRRSARPSRGSGSRRGAPLSRRRRGPPPPCTAVVPTSMPTSSSSPLIRLGSSRVGAGGGADRFEPTAHRTRAGGEGDQHRVATAQRKGAAARLQLGPTLRDDQDREGGLERRRPGRVAAARPGRTGRPRPGAAARPPVGPGRARRAAAPAGRAPARAVDTAQREVEAKPRWPWRRPSMAKPSHSSSTEKSVGSCSSTRSTPWPMACGIPAGDEHGVARGHRDGVEAGQQRLDPLGLDQPGQTSGVHGLAKAQVHDRARGRHCRR